MDTSIRFIIWISLCVLVSYASDMESPESCRSRFIFPEVIKNRRTNCSMKCAIVPSSDPRYDDLRRHTNNLRYACDAAYIVLPKNTEDLVSILQNAVNKDLRPTVRSGGHCYEDFWSNNTGGILIDMASMNKIYRSPKDSLIWVEAGVKVQQLYDILYREYGLTVPAGSCLDMGVGGHVAGAGYGNLARKYGLIIDYVESIEFVHVTENRTAEAVVVGRKSKREEDKNLFWGLLGGGTQNFGIITKVGFRDLPQSPPLVYSYDARWTLKGDLNRERFLDLMHKYAKFFAENSDPDSKFRDLGTDMQLWRSRKDGSSVTLNVLVLGNKRELAEEFFDYLGVNGSELMKKVKCQEMSYYRFTRAKGVQNNVNSDGHYYVRRSAYMVGPMPLQQREALWHYMTDPAYSGVVDGSLQIRSYGCAVSRIPENATAYPHRKAVLKLQYGTMWYEEKDAPEQWRWSRDFYRGMYGDRGPVPDGVMDGCFVNYPDRELDDWQHLYFKDNYGRLMIVKQQWDPLNVFKHRQSVELPSVRYDGN